MAISAYVGLPGHGKSYTVTEHVIFPALKAGRCVFTNIPMNDEECERQTGHKVVSFKTEDILDNPNWWTEVFLAGSIIVIDEVWRLWPSGLRANKARDQDKTFINEHRHMVADGFSTEVVLVTQDLADISTFARNKVDTTFKVVKLTKIGSKNKYRLDIYEGAVVGPDPSVKKRSNQIWGMYKKDIFKLYESQTRGDGVFGDESRTDNRFNVLKGWMFKVIPVVILGLGLLVWNGFNDVKDYYSNPSEVEVFVGAVTSIETPSVISTPKKVKNRFFDDIDKIFIASNNEILGPQFFIHSNDGQAVVGFDVFVQLGIQIKNFSDCLVLFFENGSQIGKALCMPDRPESFINRLAGSTEELSI